MILIERIEIEFVVSLGLEKHNGIYACCRYPLACPVLRRVTVRFGLFAVRNSERCYMRGGAVCDIDHLADLDAALAATAGTCRELYKETRGGAEIRDRTSAYRRTHQGLGRAQWRRRSPGDMSGHVRSGRSGRRGEVREGSNWFLSQSWSTMSPRSVNFRNLLYSNAKMTPFLSGNSNPHQLLVCLRLYTTNTVGFKVMVS